MAKIYPEIDESIAAWLKQQHMFFVATAPLAAEGLVNCSPKGLETFVILDPHTVAYLDLTGSGVETAAHLKENGRIVLMFCAFEGPARIMRLHGQGTVIEPHHPDFAALRVHFPEMAGMRSIIRVKVNRVADSCGYGVPKYAYQGQRESHRKYFERLGPEGTLAYQADNNRYSLDGLPGVEVSRP